MKFTKMQGIGNDYVYVNCFEEKIENPSKLAVKISDRHFGVGADGLIMINPSEKADFEMEMYNADGSRGEMCGNGIRCVGKYVYDHKLTDKEIDKIIDIMLKEVVARLKDQKINIEIEPSVKKLIASKGIDKNFGARPLRRTIQSVLEDSLAEEILDGKLKKNKVNKIGVKDEKVVVEK